MSVHTQKYNTVLYLTVPAYYLQHPSRLSRRGWEEMRNTLSSFLVDGISVGQMRRQAKIPLDSGRRDFSFRKGERMKLAGIVWSSTIANIRLENAEAYRADIHRRVRSVLDDLATTAKEQ